MDKTHGENKLGLRERKHIKLRKAITQTSIDLFFVNGFDQTTVNDIVDKIDISKQTFFRYFDSKESVVITPYHELFNIDLNLFNNAAPPDPVIILQDAYRKFADQYDNNKVFYIAVEKFISNNSSIRAKKTDLLYQETKKLCNAIIKSCSGNQREWLKNQVKINLSICAFVTAIDAWVYSNGKRKLRKIIDKAFYLGRKEGNKVCPTN